MPSYNDQQSRLEQSFRGLRTMCVVDCSACGRVHFVACDGHGDYSEGELDELLEKAKSQPEKYIPEWEYDHVDAVYIDGKQLVPDCPCGKYKRYCEWIEQHADELAAYLILLFQDRIDTARREIENATAAIAGLQATEAAT